MKKLNDQELKEIIILITSKTKSLKDLSKLYNISTVTLSKILKENGIVLNNIPLKIPNKFTKDKELDIIKRYNRGESQKDIALLYNTYNTSIRRVLNRYKIPIRSNSKIQKLCKHNPFKKNDELSEYFLGLLLTDGCITNTRLVLSLQEKDKDLIELYRNWISPNTKISKNFQKYNKSSMLSVSITNDLVIETLQRKGNFYNKSLNCKIYDKITWHTLRGIFDGDGCIYTTDTSAYFIICGASKVFLTQIFNFLKKENFDVKFVQKTLDKWHKQQMYEIRLYKQDQVMNLFNKLYSNAHVFLKRKYMKWLDFYESRRNKMA